MNENDNVVPMPNKLERKATNIKKLLGQQQSNRQEWIEMAIALAIEVLDARTEFKKDIDFGNWCACNDLRLNKNARAALVEMGADPIRMRAVLEKSQRTSFESIHRYDWKIPRVPKLRKPPQKLPSIEGLRKADEQKIEAIIRAEFKRLQKQYDEMVRTLNATIEEKVERLFNERKAVAFPKLQETLEKANERREMYNKLINDYHAPFTGEEYRAILLCTHEANPSEETRKRAFMALNAKKLQLTGGR